MLNPIHVNQSSRGAQFTVWSVRHVLELCLLRWFLLLRQWHNKHLGWLLTPLYSQVDGNIGAVFGIGHCPQRGGPFQFLDSYGHQNFVDQMNRYQEQHGFRFEPAQIVIDSAKSGESYMKW